MRNVRVLSLSLACMLAASFGCGVAHEPNQSTVNPPVSEPDAALGAVCKPGVDTKICACPNGTSGLQVCCDDGKSFGSCLCAVGPSANVDAQVSSQNDASVNTIVCLFPGDVPERVKNTVCFTPDTKQQGHAVCESAGNNFNIICISNTPSLVNSDAAIVGDTLAATPDVSPDTILDVPLSLPDTDPALPDIATDHVVLVDAVAIIHDATLDEKTDTAVDTGSVITPDTAPVALLDGGMSCVEKTIIGNQCFDEVTSRFGFTVCKNNREQCVWYTPPSASDCTGWREGEVDYYSTCSFKPGCDNGIYVCRSMTWRCEQLLNSYYWYVAPQCLPQNDAGTGGTVGTGGSIGSGGAVGTGGVLGTGGVIATGGTVVTGGAVGTGGNIGTGGTTSTPDANPDIPILNNGKVLVDCVNTDPTGAFITLTLDGNIGATGNLVTPTASGWRGAGPVICPVSNFTGWDNHTYCLPFNYATTTHVVFPSVPVRVSGDTQLTYIIDDGVGQMVWSQNAQFVYVAEVSPAVNRCTNRYDGQSNIVTPNVTPVGGGG